MSAFLAKTRVLWLDVQDEPGSQSDRAFIERNVIGLLSRHSIIADDWRSQWLGFDSENLDIACSGLWNLDHLYYQPHEQFLDVLSAYISTTLGERPAPSRSIAPISWYTQKKAI